MPVSHSVLRSRLLSKLVTETSRSPRRRCHLRGVHWFIAVMSSEAPSLAASSLSVRGGALRKKKVLLRLATMGPAAQAIVTVIYSHARQSPQKTMCLVSSAYG